MKNPDISLARDLLAKEPRRAAEILSGIISREGETDPEALLLLGRIESRQGKYLDAMASFFHAGNCAWEDGETRDRSVLSKFSSLYREMGEFRTARALINWELQNARSAQEQAQVKCSLGTLVTHPCYPTRDLALGLQLAEEAGKVLDGAWKVACFELAAYSCVEDPDSDEEELRNRVSALDQFPAGENRIMAANRAWMRGVAGRRLGCETEAVEELQLATDIFNDLEMPCYAGICCVDLAVCGIEFQQPGLVSQAAGRAFEVTRNYRRATRRLSASHRAIDLLVQFQRAISLNQLSRICAGRIKFQLQRLG